jgi:hypothetical protein
MDPRADLDDVEKRKFLTLLGLERRLLGRPAPGESLYLPAYEYVDLLSGLPPGWQKYLSSLLVSTPV